MFGPDVLFEVRSMGTFSHVTIGYILPEMLEDYVIQLNDMIHIASDQVDVGYTCCFKYNWDVCKGDNPPPGVDHIINIVPVGAIRPSARGLG